jgi:hypothetical protein
MFITQPNGYKNNASEKFKRGFWMTPPNEEYTLDYKSMVHIASIYNSFLVEFSRKNNHDYCDANISLKPTYDFFMMIVITILMVQK